MEEKVTYDRLSKLIEKIDEAMKMSQRKGEDIDRLNENLYSETSPVMVERIRESIETGKRDKDEFDDMTKSSLLEAKKQILMLKREKESELQEKLLGGLEKEKEIQKKLSERRDKQQRIQEKLESMKKRDLSPEKLEEVKRIAQQASEKVNAELIELQQNSEDIKLELVKVQQEHREFIGKLDMQSGKINDYAIELGIENEINKVTLTNEEPEKEEKPDRSTFDVYNDGKVWEELNTEPKLKAETKVEPKPKPEAKVEPKPKAEAKVEPKPKAETKVDPKPKVETKVEPKAEVKVDPKPKAEAKVDPKPKAEAKVDPKPKVEAKVEPKAEVKPEQNTELKQESKPVMGPSLNEIPESKEVDKFFGKDISKITAYTKNGLYLVEFKDGSKELYDPKKELVDGEVQYFKIYNRQINRDKRNLIRNTQYRNINKRTDPYIIFAIQEAYENDTSEIAQDYINATKNKNIKELGFEIKYENIEQVPEELLKINYLSKMDAELEEKEKSAFRGLGKQAKNIDGIEVNGIDTFRDKIRRFLEKGKQKRLEDKKRDDSEHESNLERKEDGKNDWKTSLRVGGEMMKQQGKKVIRRAKTLGKKMLSEEGRLDVKRSLYAKISEKCNKKVVAIDEQRNNDDSR